MPEGAGLGLAVAEAIGLTDVLAAAADDLLERVTVRVAGLLAPSSRGTGFSPTALGTALDGVPEPVGPRFTGALAAMGVDSTLAVTAALVAEILLPELLFPELLGADALGVEALDVVLPAGVLPAGVLAAGVLADKALGAESLLAGAETFFLARDVDFDAVLARDLRLVGAPIWGGEDGAAALAMLS